MEGSVGRGRAELARWIGLLVLLPHLALMLAGWSSPIGRSLEPEVEGAAWSALLALPAALLAPIVLPAARARALWALVAFALACVASLIVYPPSDSFQSSRATLVLASAVAIAFASTSLDARAGELVARVAALASCVATGRGLIDFDHALAGPLQNTGATSEAALGGALIGAWLFANDRGPWRAFGLAALLLHATYAGAAPVLSGAVAAACALGIALAVGLGSRKRLAIAAALAALAFVGARAFVSAPRPAPEIAATPAVAADLGGVAARESIWRASLGLIRDHPWLGVGPGQFRAAFPPYREAEEIELQRAALGASVESEVEHAHNDVLQGFIDAGLVGGFAWLAFLAWTAWNALVALRRGERWLCALAVAALGLSINAALRAPLLWNPASSVVFFVCAGALAARRVERPSLFARVLPWLAFAALAWRAPDALRLDTVATDALEASQAGFDVVGPTDSPLVLALNARQARGDLDLAQRDWRALLALRPHNVEALIQLGLIEAQRGRVDDARRHWSHARELDPGHRGVARNLLVLALNHGPSEQAEIELERTRSTFGDDVRVDVGARALLLGSRHGLLAIERARPELADLSADELAKRADELRSRGEAMLADALESHAHREFAHDHAAAGAWHDAVRSLRQALRLSRIHAGDAAIALRLEYAAALARDGDVDDARKELEKVAALASDLEAIAPWAREALREHGLAGAPK